MRWRKVNFSELVEFMQGKQLATDWPQDPESPPFESVYEMAAIYFMDGLRVLAHSRWSGPYSPETPDIDAEEPDFWIGEPA